MKALFIVLSLAMVMAFLEGLASGTEELIRQEESSKATFYADIVARCLNGAVILVGDSAVAECKPRRPKLGGGS